MLSSPRLVIRAAPFRTREDVKNQSGHFKDISETNNHHVGRGSYVIRTPGAPSANPLVAMANHGKFVHATLL